MEYLYLFISALVSATLFPFGSEALLLYNLTIELNVYILFISASIGNTIGSVINYYLGFKGEAYLENKKYVSQVKLQKAKIYFNKYAGISLLFSWLPIIGDPITFAAGMSKYDFKKFIILVFISKSLRYLFLIFGFLYFN